MNADELISVRRKLGQTQKQFGDAIGVSKDMVNAMENGRKPISSRTAKTIGYLLAIK